jgi:peptidylprolyl isomerase
VHTLESGLQIQDFRVGEGEELQEGDYVVLEYEAHLDDGTRVDGSAGRPGPFVVRVGDPLLLPGWRQGLQGVRVGAHRRLHVPPALGYGHTGKNAVPPDSGIQYDLQVIGRFGRTDQGLQYWMQEKGRGEAIQPGVIANVNYHLTTPNTGREVMSSRRSGRRLEFAVGEGRVLAGLEQGVQLMSPGSHYLFAIPPHLAYGDLGSLPHVMPGADLLLSMELVSARPLRR